MLGRFMRSLRMWGRSNNDFYIRFWGVRGSIACAGPEVQKYGGNTSCVEMCCGGRTLIFDGGTGLRYLGENLISKGPRDIDLFLSHSHNDHVVGLPFFKPLFRRGYRVRLWSGHLSGGMTTLDVVNKLMAAPLHPVEPTCFKADIEYCDFSAGDRLEITPEIAVDTAPLQHPNGATGYRVEYGGRAACYVTDTEHDPAQMDRHIMGLVKGADLMIYDSMYTEDEFKKRKGWGHSTWLEGLRLCEVAQVRRFVAFHHDPNHDDAFMDAMAARIKKKKRHSLVAREGLKLRP